VPQSSQLRSYRNTVVVVRVHVDQHVVHARTHTFVYRYVKCVAESLRVPCIVHFLVTQSVFVSVTIPEDDATRRGCGNELVVRYACTHARTRSTDDQMQGSSELLRRQPQCFRHDDYSSLGPCLVPKTTKNFQDSPSHRILQHMHKTLNIDKNKN